MRSHDSQEIPMETREFILKYIPILRKSVIYIHRVHLALFYLRGIFYHLAKRMSGIQYVSIAIIREYSQVVFYFFLQNVCCG